MKCQFVKDNNGTIWLQRAFDIVSRPSHRVQMRRAKFLGVEDSELLKAEANRREEGKSIEGMNAFEK